MQCWVPMCRRRRRFDHCESVGPKCARTQAWIQATQQAASSIHGCLKSGLQPSHFGTNGSSSSFGRPKKTRKKTTKKKPNSLHLMTIASQRHTHKPPPPPRPPANQNNQTTNWIESACNSLSIWIIRASANRFPIAKTSTNQCMHSSPSLTENSQTIIECDHHCLTIAGQYGAVENVARVPVVRFAVHIHNHWQLMIRRWRILLAIRRWRRRRTWWGRWSWNKHKKISSQHRPI